MSWRRTTHQEEVDKAVFSCSRCWKHAPPRWLLRSSFSPRWSWSRRNHQNHRHWPPSPPAPFSTSWSPFFHFCHFSLFTWGFGRIWPLLWAFCSLMWDLTPMLTEMMLSRTYLKSLLLQFWDHVSWMHSLSVKIVEQCFICTSVTHNMILPSRPSTELRLCEVLKSWGFDIPGKRFLRRILNSNMKWWL